MTTSGGWIKRIKTRISWPPHLTVATPPPIVVVAVPPPPPPPPSASPPPPPPPPPPPGPVNTIAPVVTGSLVVSSTLTCSTGTWANSPTSYAYQWHEGGALVGTNANAYVSTTIAATIFCVVTATSASGSSSASALVVGPITGIVSPTLTRTTSAGTNRMSWSGSYPGAIEWDGVSAGDKVDMQWRVNGGAWNADTRQLLDEPALLTGAFAWPLFGATTFASGAFVEAQERIVRFVAGVNTDSSQWSSSVSDTMA